MTTCHLGVKPSMSTKSNKAAWLSFFIQAKRIILTNFRNCSQSYPFSSSSAEHKSTELGE